MSAKSDKPESISLTKTISSITLRILAIFLFLFTAVSITDQFILLKDTKVRIFEDNLNTASEIIRNQVLTARNMIYDYRGHGHSRKEILDYLRLVRFGANNEGYIFVVSYDGTTLMNDTQKELEGVNIWDMEDPDGVKVIQEERKAAEKEGGDFIYYSWNKPSTGVIAPKVSFVTGVPEYEWMVGAGLYLDDIEAEYSALKKQIYRNIFVRIGFLIIIISFSLLYLLYRFKLLGFSVSKDIEAINRCFYRIELENRNFDTSELNYVEFLAIAEQANRTLAERQKAEKERNISELRLRLQREQSPLAYVGWDRESRIVEWNPSAEEIFGFTREEAMGKGLDFLIPDDDLDRIKTLFRELPQEKNRKKNINRNITKSGRIITCEWYNNTLVDDDGEFLGIVAIGMDISEKIRTDMEIIRKTEALEESLKEKQVLLTEVHHRVKNNMAIISSLLSIQADTAENSKLSEYLRSSQNRIKSMALVHEHLYKSGNLKYIKVRNYIKSLVDSLLDAYGLSDGSITIREDLIDTELELDTLIPLGMLISEIVSNSLKHAYRSAGNGLILEISMEESSGLVTIVIADNGPGFTPSEDRKSSESIGLLLIDTLIKQLSGELKAVSDKGTSYTIKFRKNAKSGH